MSTSFHHFLNCGLSTLLLAGVCFGQTTERVSLASSGAQGNADSFYPAISQDGRYVAFTSVANNLVAGGTWFADIYVRDRLNDTLSLVSGGVFGASANQESSTPSISADGRFIAFASLADNLVVGDTNGVWDIFVHDSLTGVTNRVSVSSLGIQADNDCGEPVISADGLFVAYSTRASTLVFGDNNQAFDIFVYDRTAGTTERVNLSTAGVEAVFDSYDPSLSEDGRYVAFDSWSGNLVLTDTNFTADIFVRDRLLSVTERVNLDSSGGQANFDSTMPAISANGQFIAFESNASNLAPGDSNAESDIFVRDRISGTTERVSVSFLGVEGNAWSVACSISADGRYVSFDSGADNFVPGDTPMTSDIFVHDRVAGVTSAVGVNSLGQLGGSFWHSALSADGQFVAITSGSNILVAGDTNTADDVFVRDRWNGLGANSFLLTGPSTAATGVALNLNWFLARPSSNFWLIYSPSMSGSIVGGHAINLGPPMTIQATGVNAPDGSGSYTSPPVPAAAAGHTFYFEVVARDATFVLFDSNAIGIAFF